MNVFCTVVGVVHTPARLPSSVDCARYTYVVEKPLADAVYAMPVEPEGSENENRVTEPTTVPVTSVHVEPVRTQNFSGTVLGVLQNSHDTLLPLGAVTVTFTVVF